MCIMWVKICKVLGTISDTLKESCVSYHPCSIAVQQIASSYWLQTLIYSASRFCGSGLQTGMRWFVSAPMCWEEAGGWLDGLGLGYLEAPSFTCLASGLGCTWRLGLQTGAPSSGLSSQHQASQNSCRVAQSSRCKYPSKQDRNCPAFYSLILEVT